MRTKPLVGRNFSFTLSERNGVQLEVAGMEPRSIRSVSARRVEKWLAQFNDDPAAGPETYRNEGIEESPAYNARFFLALARAAHNAAD